MKRFLLLVYVMTFVIINYSCDENFSPKGDFLHKYILNCVIRGDTSLQTATISSSYDVDGYDPYNNSDDPFLKDAFIRIWVGNEVYFMKDSSIARADSSRYKTPFHFFYIDNFKPLGNTSMEIEAILPNGKTLVAETAMPEPVEWNYTNVDTTDTNAYRIPSLSHEYFSYSWFPGSSVGWYLPRLILVYSKLSNGIEERHETLVPEKYGDIGRGIQPLFPAPTKNTVVNFTNSALDSVLLHISAGDPVKSSYKIYALVLELLVFDDNLSKYYSVTNGFLDDYTIVLDENDYSNVEGGLGIFGSYVKQKRGSKIASKYISSFGYVPANP